ncbi:acyl dehydratase [Nocardioides sp. J9]|uniref:MaoC family dehydratase n=1 Tax=unclassified Nocardioides TaxID=2615069 RepID=UPI00048D1B1F|nr:MULTISPECIES: MaoC family dehydratase [unclassified Nocardioides]TWH02686.1 acyl dehydratase [Nocardioides sp. J9]
MTQHTYPLRPANLSDLLALVGVEIGPTGWRPVDQAAVTVFADVTEDRQWIHVDPVRAAASPLGGTIAHGLFTLSLGPALFYELVSLEGFAHGLNYGYDRVRFPAPLPVGSRVRMTWRLLEVDAVAGGIQLRSRQTFEREGGDRPVCVAESVARVVPVG